MLIWLNLTEDGQPLGELLGSDKAVQEGHSTGHTLMMRHYAYEVVSSVITSDDRLLYKGTVRFLAILRVNIEQQCIHHWQRKQCCSHACMQLPSLP